jgi:death-on-curing protein
MSWRWLLDELIIALHGEQIAEHGGRAGIRDAGLLSSALARPQNKAVCGDASVFDLASAYASGIIRNHPFIDGNKRTGFLAAYTFLLAAVLALASGDIDKANFSAWLKDHSVSQLMGHV